MGGEEQSEGSGRRRWVTAAVLAAAAALAVVAVPAHATARGVKPGNFFYSLHEPVPLAPSPEPFEPAEYEKFIEPKALLGAPADRQAGAHPDLSIGMVLHTGELEEIFEGLDTPETTEIELPPGVLANLGEIPSCSRASFERNTAWISYEEPPPIDACPAASQVGVVGALFGGELVDRAYPLYKLEPEPGHIAELAFPYEILSRRVPMVIDVDLRTDGGYRLDLTRSTPTHGLSYFLPAPFMTLWGVPGSPVHNAERINPDRWTWGAPLVPPYPPLVSSVTGCEPGPTEARLRLDYVNSEGRFELPEPGEEPLYRAFAPEQTNCEALPFAAGVEVQTTTDQVDSSTGLRVHIHVPQAQGGGELETAPLREATISLPEGVSFNPAAASGLVGCSAAEVGLEGVEPSDPSSVRFSPGPTTCPEASRLGSVVVDTPLVEGALTGSVYLAQPRENPFRAPWALYLVVDGPGFTMKVPAKVELEPGSGQVSVTLASLPQLQIEDIELDLPDAPVAALSTPASCGARAAQARLTPWSGLGARSAAVTPSSIRFESIGQGGECDPATPKPFSPALSASLGTASASASSSLDVRIARPPGDQGLKTIGLTLPRGLALSLRGRTLCGEGEIATAEERSVGEGGGVERARPSCPGESEVGAVTVTVGTGSAPLALHGHLYLAGPYKGDPYSLVAIVPAAAGGTAAEPLFDLGTVVDRLGLRVDPRTAQLALDSDPLPRALGGIPLRIDALSFSLNAPGFIRNPSACGEKRIEAEVGGQEGGRAELAAALSVEGCEGLKFEPTVQMRAAAGIGLDPELTATVGTPPGTAGISAARIDLPPSIGLDRARLGEACRPSQRPRSTCPSGSIVGRAVAWTGLADEPLEGPVRLVSAGGGGLPKLSIELDGEAPLELAATLGSKRGAVRLGLEPLPDISLERLELSIGSKRQKGFLTERACVRSAPVFARLTAYNGKVARRQSTLRADCQKEE
jgi:hypothetical protein